MLKKLASISFGFFLGLIGYALFILYMYQEQLLFKSKPLKNNHLFVSEHSFEELLFTSNDSTPIHALLYKTPSIHPKGVVVYFHGRGGNLASSWGKVADDFLTRSYDVLIMDYRGFGKSHGAISEKALLGDASMVYEYACKRYGKERTVVYGRSLGTGIATYVASQYPVPLVMLEAPYFSMYHLVSMKFPLVPKPLLSLLLKYPLRTDQWMETVSAQVELFHGTSDKLIPHQSSELLYQVASRNNPHAHLTIITGGTHNSLPFSNAYQERLDTLLGVVEKS